MVSSGVLSGKWMHLVWRWNRRVKGVDFAGEKAVDATNYAIDLAANPNFKLMQMDQDLQDFVMAV